MINLYLFRCHIKEDNRRLVSDMDLEFSESIIPLTLNKQDVDIMKLIDGVIYNSADNILSRFGYTNVYKLSTGCKALIILNHLLAGDIDKNIALDLTDTGSNVMQLAFNMVNNTDVCIYTQQLSLEDITAFSKAKYVYNIQHIGEMDDIGELYEVMEFANTDED